MALDTRAAAARVLAKVLGGQSLNQALPPLLDQVAARDTGLLQQLCYGSLRHYPKLQAILVQLLDKPLRDKDRDVTALLLIGLYQLDETRIPDHAAVAATVAAVKTLKKPWSKGLVNAVLRRYLRERDALVGKLSQAATAAHPKWIFQQLQQQWPQAADAIIEANNNQPPMTLRVNEQKTNRAAYLTLLEQAGIAAVAGVYSAQAICLQQAVDVTELPQFSEGVVSVQDEAAQLAAALLQAAPGERVLDACAAPGGKTCHILELQPELAEMVALDIDQQRLTRVTENLERLQLSATLMTADAGAPPAALRPASFDRILVDAPCSASGVIRRHPDVKVLRREQDIAALGKQQLLILQGLWPLLKTGGTLLYATCSVFEQENSQVIAAFIDQQPGACIAAPELTWGEPTHLGRQMLPSLGGPDGLFYAILTKTG